MAPGSGGAVFKLMVYWCIECINVQEDDCLWAAGYYTQETIQLASLGWFYGRIMSANGEHLSMSSSNKIYWHQKPQSLAVCCCKNKKKVSSGRCFYSKIFNFQLITRQKSSKSDFHYKTNSTSSRCRAAVDTRCVIGSRIPKHSAPSCLIINQSIFWLLIWVFTWVLKKGKRPPSTTYASSDPL